MLRASLGRRGAVRVGPVRGRARRARRALEWQRADRARSARGSHGCRRHDGARRDARPRRRGRHRAHRGPACATAPGCRFDTELPAAPQALPWRLAADAGSSCWPAVIALSHDRRALGDAKPLHLLDAGRAKTWAATS
ncbi:MAG: hypothetical protein MZW92_80065 [Comamonadaceae bacterium]|nr:hypothetical protein [Comamonadaceae bacterium]